MSMSENNKDDVKEDCPLVSWRRTEVKYSFVWKIEDFLAKWNNTKFASTNGNIILNDGKVEFDFVIYLYSKL